MDALTEAFYDVMYSYRIPFSPAGVEANLAQWREAKRPLLELLRRHPNWNERELAVVFDLAESRELDRNTVDENKFEMILLAQEAGLSPKQIRDFEAALNAATADYSTVPDPSRLPVIQERGHIKCAEGQKASRIINRLCCKFRLDQYEVEKVFGQHGDNPAIRRIKPYNAAFARLADSLNPIQIPKTGVLSIHPCDFLEMSSRRNAWHSCHCLADGGWRAGCQSYMGDGVSMIFFTVDDDVREDFYKAPRLTRQIFCYKDGLLLQSRLYPSNDEATRKLYRSLVQKVISQCLGEANLWKTKTETNEIKVFWETTEGAWHYKDYDNSYAALSFLKSAREYGRLKIGSHSLCPCCGQPNGHRNRVKCDECTALTVCKGCSEVIPQSDTRNIDDFPYCKKCANVCSSCGRPKLASGLHPTINSAGETVYLCADCLARETEPCDQCGARSFCRDVGLVRFCPNSEYTPAA